MPEGMTSDESRESSDDLVQVLEARGGGLGEDRAMRRGEEGKSSGKNSAGRGRNEREREDITTCNRESRPRDTRPKIQDPRSKDQVGRTRRKKKRREQTELGPSQLGIARR